MNIGKVIIFEIYNSFRIINFKDNIA
ncbi:hypothetical protein VCR6J2_610210 [Vibrio coralliirubri]|nr:hypothetical protein VCR6J2_610210 [Vibrio coralliirubri]CDT86704.1 hypothetical protein VCR29J2_700163 [Vibrio coralliirubri]